MSWVRAPPPQPAKEIDMENTTNSKIIAEKFNVSEETLRKWCREYHIPFYLDRKNNVYILPENAFELIMSVKMVSLEERKSRTEQRKRLKESQRLVKERSERAKRVWRERKERMAQTEETP